MTFADASIFRLQKKCSGETKGGGAGTHFKDEPEQPSHAREYDFGMQ